ncbi:protoglobin domain-containing protein [uncultured Roseibium sp.]|uniref:protoglobin domain-containing protein n=1 Tax=uncultured Roseibium sp. TaxID=1936171 RepID=UPI0032175C38
MLSPDQHELREYIDFIDLNRQDVIAARKAWDIIRPNINDVLTYFYSSQIMKQTERQFPKFDIPTLISKQITHWDTLFSGGLDEDYVNSIKRIGSAHRRINVSLPYYVISYGVFLNEFERILRFHHKNQSDIVNLMSGLRKFILLDLALACSAERPISTTE